MAVKNPTITVSVSGDKITTLSESYTFSLENKLEVSFTIPNAGTEVIDYSNIANINAIVMTADADFVVILSKDTGANIIEIAATSAFPVVLPVKDAFVDGLDSITLRNDNAEDLNVSVRVYGEAVSA